MKGPNKTSKPLVKGLEPMLYEALIVIAGLFLKFTIVIKSKKEINILGMIFDSKSQWGPQVANAITKSTRALNAISLIRNYFNQEELLKLKLYKL